MKKKYLNPEMEIILLGDCDIIVTSDGVSIDSDDTYHDQGIGGTENDDIWGN